VQEKSNAMALKIFLNPKVQLTVIPLKGWWKKVNNHEIVYQFIGDDISGVGSG